MEPTIEQQTEWLNDFQQAHRDARYALGAIAGQIAALYQVGLNGVAATLTEPLRVAEESVAAMDDAVTRMIREDAQAGWDQIGETFQALLKQAVTTEGSELK